jgi:hypothetical protein
VTSERASDEMLAFTPLYYVLVTCKKCSALSVLEEKNKHSFYVVVEVVREFSKVYRIFYSLARNVWKIFCCIIYFEQRQGEYKKFRLSQQK